jgi:hypothetical protein
MHCHNNVIIQKSVFEPFTGSSTGWSPIFKLYLIFLLILYKVLQDNAKSRRELSLHWKAGACPFIVKIKEVYENKFMKRASLLAVMEWYVLPFDRCCNVEIKKKR